MSINKFMKLFTIMKIRSLINVACFSLLIGGLTSQTSSYAQNVSPSQLMVQSTAEKNNSAAIKNKAEKMINLFFAQEFGSLSDLVVPELKVRVSPENMKKAWQEIKEDKGNFLKISESKVIDTPGSDLVTLTIEFDKVREDWIFLFNDNQQIVGINAPISKDIKTIANEFMDSVISGNYSQARAFLHPFLKETIFPKQIESGWNTLLAKNGKFEQILSTNIKRGSALDGTDIVVMNLQFGKSEKKILIILDRSKNITGVDFVQL